MIWHVRWEPRAEGLWKKLDPADQHLLARGAVAFAERQEGEFELVSRVPEITLLLYVGRFELFMLIDEAERVVRVLWVRRSGR
jgi:mRNA-degrading endonuclease RelE of RelBE toxin-antitoxin system